MGPGRGSLGAAQVVNGLVLSVYEYCYCNPRDFGSPAVL